MDRIEQLHIVLDYYVLVLLENFAQFRLANPGLEDAKVYSHQVLEFDYSGSNIVETLCRNSAHVMFCRVLETAISDREKLEEKLRDVATFQRIIVERGLAMMAELSTERDKYDSLKRFVEQLALEDVNSSGKSTEPKN